MPAFSSTDELTVFSTALAGQYEVEREIGRGGMGVVYLARDLRLDRMVAIKTLPPSLASDQTVRERFLREARTAARLSHPNIVPVHRADEVGGQVFFVMGFVDGDSLAGRLAETAALSPKQALPILRDVAAALAYAHRHGVIHRDVKTENILLDTMTGRAMVTDFGIARMGEAAPLTATGQVLGTVYYLSPEQVSGDDVDARSDIYALGVVGYATLSGQFPFDAPLASAVLVAHVNKQPVPLAAVAPHVPASLASIIDRCLAKNPGHRYQSCEELDAALVAATADANRVTSTSSSQSPLVSNTEANLIFRRAAELQDMTRPHARPIDPIDRDKAKDAARKDGFKTTNLREAAREAGIDEAFMQHALAERGLAPRAPNSPVAPTEEVTVTDLTPKPTWWGGEPTRLSYETVIAGEVSEQDFDILVDTIRSRAGAWGEVGQVNTVGKSLTWTSQSKSGRKLQVSIFPRNGKTTIRIFESLSETYAGIYGGVMGGMGGGGGAIVMALAKNLQPFEGVWGRGLENPNVQLGFALWLGAVVPLSYLISRFIANGVSSKRQETLESLIRELAARARETMDYRKP
jgi:serine/threonine-protein kinase